MSSEYTSNSLKVHDYEIFMPNVKTATRHRLSDCTDIDSEYSYMGQTHLHNL